MSVPLEPVVWVVVRRGGWDPDIYICAYHSRDRAEEHRDQLNGEPYDPDGTQEHYVWPLPWGDPPA